MVEIDFTEDELELLIKIIKKFLHGLSAWSNDVDIYLVISKPVRDILNKIEKAYNEGKGDKDGKRNL